MGRTFLCWTAIFRAGTVPSFVVLSGLTSCSIILTATWWEPCHTAAYVLPQDPMPTLPRMMSPAVYLKGTRSADAMLRGCTCLSGRDEAWLNVREWRLSDARVSLEVVPDSEEAGSLLISWAAATLCGRFHQKRHAESAIGAPKLLTIRVRKDWIAWPVSRDAIWSAGGVGPHGFQVGFASEMENKHTIYETLA